MKTAILSGLTIAPDRQRGADSPAMAPAAIAALADSIEARGLMQPLVVEWATDGRTILRAGERRSKAIGLLYAQNIPIRFGSNPVPLGEVPVVEYRDLTPLEAFLVELEENEKREPLTLQEKARAYATLHSLLSPKAESPRQALVETYAAYTHIPPSDADTRAREVGGVLKDTHQLVVIGQHLDDPDVAKAKTQREAVKIISRKARKAEDAKALLVHSDTAILGDAIEVLSSLPDGSFHGIVSDPPYGIGITQMSYQNSSEQKYDDSYENWLVLIPRLLGELGRVLTPDTHGYLFCDFNRFGELVGFLDDAGFESYSRPLIWDRSPDGRLTTAEKWPRRTYECIVYFRRGNRDLLEVRGDVLRYSADRDQGNYHGAKKPVELCADLITRSFRAGEKILDPFAGSFAVARAGKRLNVGVLSIEGDPAYHSLGTKLLEADHGEF